MHHSVASTVVQLLIDRAVIGLPGKRICSPAKQLCMADPVWIEDDLLPQAVTITSKPACNSQSIAELTRICQAQSEELSGQHLDCFLCLTLGLLMIMHLSLYSSV